MWSEGLSSDFDEFEGNEPDIGLAASPHATGSTPETKSSETGSNTTVMFNSVHLCLLSSPTHSTGQGPKLKPTNWTYLYHMLRQGRPSYNDVGQIGRLLWGVNFTFKKQARNKLSISTCITWFIFCRKLRFYSDLRIAGWWSGLFEQRRFNTLLLFLSQFGG